MNEIKFIENNVELIVQETINKYNENAGYTLSAADAERVMIDVLAYRESLIRSAMERAMRCNFVQTAIGQSLDYWGELFGVTRNEKQTDDEYRQIILAQSKIDAIGTRAAYTAKIKTIKAVADVLLITKQEDITIPPGVIKIIAIQKEELKNGIIKANIADEAVKKDIQQAVSDVGTNIIGDLFIFNNAIPISIDGKIQVRKTIGANDKEFLDSLNYQVDKYFADLSLSFNGQFGNYDLERQMLKATGINQVISISFVNVPILRQKEFYNKGNISIEVL